MMAVREMVGWSQKTSSLPEKRWRSFSNSLPRRMENPCIVPWFKEMGP